MRRLFAVITCVTVALLVGCSDTGKGGASGKGNGNGVEVQWPGGHVKYDAEKGLDVKAPDVNVQVDKDKNVGVKAPGVDVDVKRGASKSE